MSTRSQKADMAAALRNRGLTLTESAAEMGISVYYLKQLLYDPSGEKERARKRRYAGVCDDCGGPTSGRAGGNKKKLPKRCAYCACGHKRPVVPKTPPAERPTGPRICSCGTVLNSYNESEPPRCNPCQRTASEEAHARLLEEAAAAERADNGAFTAALMEALAVRAGTVTEIAQYMERDIGVVRRRLNELCMAGRVTRRYQERVGRGASYTYFAAEALDQDDLDELMGAASA